MTATADMIAELRRMVDEPNNDPYDDDVLGAYIERYPVLDALGTKPIEVDYSTEPPTLSERSEWIPTYDLHAAAADIWQEKSATVAEDYNFTADGSTLSRGDVQEQYMKQTRHHLARRKVKTITARMEPRLGPDSEEGLYDD